MATVKVSDLVKTYEDNNVSGDFNEWCDKLELVAKLQKVDDLVTFMPLFLCGPAFAVYKQLSDDTKKDYELMKKAMILAFCESSHSAYEQLRVRTLGEGETVDVYVADLRRLTGLMGQKVANPLIKCAFMAGLPSDISTQLKSMTAVDDIPLHELVSKARMMLSTRSVNSLTCAVGQARIRKCYICSSTQHLANRCLHAAQNGQQSSPGNSTKRKEQCWKCKEVGHFQAQCPQGNEDGAASAPDAPPRK